MGEVIYLDDFKEKRKNEEDNDIFNAVMDFVDKVIGDENVVF